MDNPTEKKLKKAISKFPVYTTLTSRAEFLKALLAVGAMGAVGATVGSCSIPTPTLNLKIGGAMETIRNFYIQKRIELHELFSCFEFV